MSDFEYVTCPCMLGLYTCIRHDHAGAAASGDGVIGESVRSGSEYLAGHALSRDPIDFEAVLAVIPCSKYPDFGTKHEHCRFKLAEAIKVRKESLLETQNCPSEACMHLCVLARLRHLLFLATGRIEHLVAAISGVNRSIRLSVLDNHHQAMLWAELAIYHDSSFHHCGARPESILDIERGIHCLSRAQTLLADNPFSPLLCYLLRERASLFLCRYRCDPEGQNLEDTIDSLHLSVQSIPRPVSRVDMQGLITCLNLLTDTLMARFETMHNSEDLDRAIEIQEQALILLPDIKVTQDGSIDQSFVHLSSEVTLDALTTYSNRLCTRFTSSGQFKDLQDASFWARQVVRSDYDHFESSTTRRRNSYLNCCIEELRAFGRSEGINVIMEFIKDNDDPRYGYFIGRLLIVAFERVRIKDYIDTAVGLLVRALGRTRNNFVSSGGSGARDKKEGYMHHRDVAANYEVLVQNPGLSFIERPGAMIVPRLNVDWVNISSQYNLLARAFTLLYECSELRQERDIEQAILNHLEALKRTPATSYLRQQFLLSMGSSYRVWSERTGNKEHLRSAIAHQRQALENIHPPHPYRTRALSGLAQSLLRKHGIDSLAPEISTDYQESLALFKEAVQYEYGFIFDRLSAALLWANLLHNLKADTAKQELEYLTRALEGYRQSVALLIRATSMAVSIPTRFSQLSTLPRGFASDAAACAFRIAELDLPRSQEHLAGAVELLDQGRAILWSQAAQIRHDLHRLKEKRQDLAQELERIYKAQERASFGGEVGVHSGEMTRLAVTQWNQCVDNVRRVEGFGDFLQHLPFSKLRVAAQPAPIVIVNASDHRCDGLIIPSEGDLRIVPLKQLTKGDVDDDVEDFLKALESRPKQDRGHFSYILGNLWTNLGEPIMRGLREAKILVDNPSFTDPPHIQWCPTGKLAFLPIHATCPPTSRERGMLDYVVSSYIPTLSTVLHTQRPRRSSDISMDHTARPSRPYSRILAVCHPGRGSYTGIKPLQFVEKELGILRKYANQGVSLTVLSNEAARSSDVQRALQDADWVHFACHGMRNVANPMESALVLDDRDMTLSELARTQRTGLAGEFAMLLACETAMGDPGLSDEAMHVAAGLQFAGFKSIIASMWKIEDKLGPLVTESIYSHLIGHDADHGDGHVKELDAKHAAHALRLAQLYMRDELKLHSRRWAPFIHYGV